jgi:hypothetical protein
MKLLDSMQYYPAGIPYRTHIVVNAEVDSPLVLPPRYAHIPISYRDNTGYNIGAWDHGWRLYPNSRYFLFMQDDCIIRRKNWLKVFRDSLHHKKIGIIGESLSLDWNRTWEQLASDGKLSVQMAGHVIEGKQVSRGNVYFKMFKLWGIDPGERADHLRSLIWACRRDVLELIDGFPIGMDYGQAIAAEIATSKKIQQAGFYIKQIRWRPFTYIEHPEWIHTRDMSYLIKAYTKELLSISLHP